jgi:glycosyltransferase involved in cell wall biosynthesis
MKLSVAVCTWNRAGLLDQTLGRMRALRVPDGVTWELLVVNNRCTDGTDEVLRRHAAALPLRRVYEERQGHSHARNRAVAESQGDVVVWTDDDVLVDPEWLAAYADVCRAHPEAPFFGGPVEPWYAAEPPRWVRENLPRIANVYAIRLLGDTVRPLGSEEFPVGASMAMPTRLLRQHPFDTTRGRLGSSLRGGDEIALLRALRARYGPGVWVGTARLRHYIPAERLTARYVWEWLRWDAREKWRGAGFPEAPRLWGYPRYVLRWYWASRLRAALLSPWKSQAWFESFVRGAELRGMLDEYKGRGAAPPAEPEGVSDGHCRQAC